MMNIDKILYNIKEGNWEKLSPSELFGEYEKEVERCKLCNNILRLPDVYKNGYTYVAVCPHCRVHVDNDNIRILVNNWNSEVHNQNLKYHYLKGILSKYRSSINTSEEICRFYEYLMYIGIFISTYDDQCVTAYDPLLGKKLSPLNIMQMTLMYKDFISNPDNLEILYGN